VERVSPNFVAVAFAGESLADFVSESFDDHVKFMFRDETGELVRRDYTPRRFDPETCKTSNGYQPRMNSSRPYVVCHCRQEMASRGALARLRRWRDSGRSCSTRRPFLKGRCGLALIGSGVTPPCMKRVNPADEPPARITRPTAK
jgi:hypothetical protein